MEKKVWTLHLDTAGQGRPGTLSADSAPSATAAAADSDQLTNPMTFSQLLGGRRPAMYNIQHVQTTSLELSHTQLTIEEEWSRLYFDEGLACTAPAHQMWEMTLQDKVAGSVTIPFFMPMQTQYGRRADNGRTMVLTAPHGFAWLTTTAYAHLMHAGVYEGRTGRALFSSDSSSSDTTVGTAPCLPICELGSTSWALTPSGSNPVPRVWDIPPPVGGDRIWSDPDNPPVLLVQLNFPMFMDASEAQPHQEPPIVGALTLETQMRRAVSALQGAVFTATFNSDTQVFTLLNAPLPATESAAMIDAAVTSSMLTPLSIYQQCLQTLGGSSAYVPFSAEAVVLNVLTLPPPPEPAPGALLLHVPPPEPAGWIVMPRFHNPSAVCQLMTAMLQQYQQRQYMADWRAQNSLRNMSLRLLYVPGAPTMPAGATQAVRALGAFVFLSFDAQTGLFRLIHQPRGDGLGTRAAQTVALRGPWLDALLGGPTARPHVAATLQRPLCLFGPYQPSAYLKFAPQQLSLAEAASYPSTASSSNSLQAFEDAVAVLTLAGGRLGVQVAFPAHNFAKGAPCLPADRTWFTPYFPGGHYTIESLATALQLILAHLLYLAGLAPAADTSACVVVRLEDPWQADCARLSIQTRVPILFLAVDGSGDHPPEVGYRIVRIFGADYTDTITGNIGTCVHVELDANEPWGIVLAQHFPDPTVRPPFVYLLRAGPLHGLFRVATLLRDSNVVVLVRETQPVVPTMALGGNPATFRSILDADQLAGARLFFTHDPNYKPRNPLALTPLAVGASTVMTNTTADMHTGRGGGGGAWFDLTQLFDARDVSGSTYKTTWLTRPFFLPSGGVAAASTSSLPSVLTTCVRSGPRLATTMAGRQQQQYVSIARRTLSRGRWQSAPAIGPIPLTLNLSVTYDTDTQQVFIYTDTLPDAFYDGCLVRFAADYRTSGLDVDGNGIDDGVPTTGLRSWFAPSGLLDGPLRLHVVAMDSFPDLTRQKSARSLFQLAFSNPANANQKLTIATGIASFTNSSTLQQLKDVSLYMFLHTTMPIVCPFTGKTVDAPAHAACIPRRPALCTGGTTTTAGAFLLQSERLLDASEVAAAAGGEADAGDATTAQQGTLSAPQSAPLPFTSGLQPGQLLTFSSNELNDLHPSTATQTSAVLAVRWVPHPGATLPACVIYESTLQLADVTPTPSPKPVTLLSCLVPRAQTTHLFAEYQVAVVSSAMRTVVLDGTTVTAPEFMPGGLVLDGISNLLFLNQWVQLQFYNLTTAVPAISGRYYTCRPPPSTAMPVPAGRMGFAAAFRMPPNNTPLAFSRVVTSFVPGGWLNVRARLVERVPSLTAPATHDRCTFTSDMLRCWHGMGTTNVSGVDVYLYPWRNEAFFSGDQCLAQETFAHGYVPGDTTASTLCTQRSGALVPIMEAEADADVLNLYLVRREPELKRAGYEHNHLPYGWDRSIRAALLGLREQCYLYGVPVPFVAGPTEASSALRRLVLPPSNTSVPRLPAALSGHGAALAALVRHPVDGTRSGVGEGMVSPSSWVAVPPYTSSFAPDLDYPAYILLVMKLSQSVRGDMTHVYNPSAVQGLTPPQSGDPVEGTVTKILAKLTRRNAVAFAETLSVRDIHLLSRNAFGDLAFPHLTDYSTITLMLLNPDFTLYHTHGRHWSLSLDVTLIA